MVWTSGGYRWGFVGLLLVLLLLLLLRSRSSSSFYNTVQSALYKTANINTANTPCLKYMTSPHSTESREREREREIRLQVLLFHSVTRPFALSPFPHSNCNSLFRSRTGREREREACDWRSLVWSLKRILQISASTTKERDGIRREG